jgi:hypothetical protein
MADAITELGGLSESMSRITDMLSNKQLKWAVPSRTQPVVRPMVQSYFEFVRPELEGSVCRDGLVADLDGLMQEMIDLSTVQREKSLYEPPIGKLRPLVLEATVHLMKARGVPRLLLSQTEREILRTLEKMLPGSAKSYEQALRDIAQGGRVSWRGTAAELRDVLREVMDHLAPDAQVRSTPGFVLEPDQRGPTQKQKVRFILKARRTVSAAIDTAQGTLQTVDDSVAALARMTYTRGSASAHTSPMTTEIRNLKRYVDALLAELLEIS